MSILQMVGALLVGGFIGALILLEISIIVYLVKFGISETKKIKEPHE